ncbi:hypothetical protein ROZALSC1DRAFT_26500 [Rozella allomycis CSF55]|uniref:Uncharacterized protein n=1 Tax=Rozella allomycis (strain CSF55) TaxID=988480 RepID=A0A075B0P5_ROZAC|nr:hypothetical protein O9G_003882 [Rozella allomycis CSF55]RKP22117.1 hypothetical protein ROZALSC1DRAFT_26500 [Rozella allomycis CSF55]|eukprot:EPZ35967.1 hypothetical protein O9G_003882 [Rozella allomycis CSF55]
MLQQTFLIVHEEGISEDFIRFINDFKNKKTFSFADFKTSWADAKMAYLFLVFPFKEKRIEFMNKVYSIIFEVLSKAPSDPYHVCSCLFLLFSIYFSQPFDKKVDIRITIEMHDLAYIISKLIQSEAFVTVAVEKQEDNFNADEEIEAENNDVRVHQDENEFGDTIDEDELQILETKVMSNERISYALGISSLAELKKVSDEYVQITDSVEKNKYQRKNEKI